MTEAAIPDSFRMCSGCKKPLAFGARYYTCSVSTCNRKRMALTFCSLACWEAHVPMMRHREAWAEEQTAPTRERFLRERAEEEAAEAKAAQLAATTKERDQAMSERLELGDVPIEVLVVVSKLKQYVKARSGMNTSDEVIETLSALLRAECDAAIRRAGQDGRKTVMARDFQAGG
jgi:histone H3/H4